MEEQKTVGQFSILIVISAGKIKVSNNVFLPRNQPSKMLCFHFDYLLCLGLKLILHHGRKLIYTQTHKHTWYIQNM